MQEDASRPYLMLKDPDGNMTRVPLEELPLSIGRRSENDLQILDPTISRDHARILEEGRDYVLEDLGSTHGTFVNQERVQRRVLKGNDRIRLGGAMGHSLTFRSGDEFTLMVGTTGKTSPGEDAAPSRGTAGHRLGALLEISKALNSSLRLNDVLEKVMDAVIALTDAERGMLLLGSSADSLSLEVERNLQGGAGGQGPPQYSHSVVREVFDTGEAQILTDVAEDPRFSTQQSIVGLDLRTVMCVPLKHLPRDTENPDLEEYRTGSTAPVSDGPILGVLYVDRRSPTRHFTDEDLSLFESFAGHAAIAIENARLYEEALEKRRMDEDLRVAYRIQRSLLLSEFPELDWADMHALNIPSRGVGGDYYEFYTRPEGTLGFAVGDVSGKGIPAAMLMATLQAAFLSATVSHDNLGALCHHLNDFLVKRTSPERYATFFCGLLAPDGQLRYVNAGHNPSLRFGSGEPQRLMGGGLPLGLFPDRDYEVQTIRLEPGDMVACYSDGITEANDPAEEEFGEERLKSVLVEHRSRGAHGICKAVFDEVERFSAGTGQGDDLTLMVVRYLAGAA